MDNGALMWSDINGGLNADKFTTPPDPGGDHGGQQKAPRRLKLDTIWEKKGAPVSFLTHLPVSQNFFTVLKPSKSLM